MDIILYCILCSTVNKSSDLSMGVIVSAGEYKQQCRLEHFENIEGDGTVFVGGSSKGSCNSRDESMMWQLERKY